MLKDLFGVVMFLVFVVYFGEEPLVDRGSGATRMRRNDCRSRGVTGDGRGISRQKDDVFSFSSI